MHPVRKALESLQSKDVCPRLHVNVTHEDAVCPDFVVEKWKERLIIDLDPEYPLELSFTEIGVEANLSFGGYVTRCTFPWAAIYLVAERGTNRGQVFSDNIPASLRHEFAASNVVDESMSPTLTKVKDDDRAKVSGRRRKRRRGDKDPKVAELRPVPAPAPAPAPDRPAEAEAEAQPEAAAEAEAESEASEQTDQQAVKSRRAAFTVIDGGS